MTDPIPTKSGIDWQQAYATLERARQTLEVGEHLSPEEIRRILENRARSIAHPQAEVETPTDILELLVFVLGQERYGVETRHVLEVFPLQDLTPVPSTPAHVLGLVNHRGRILPVLDLRTLFGLGTNAASEKNQVVAVQTEQMIFGILVEAGLSVVRIPSVEMAPPPSSPPGESQAFIRAVTGTMVAVIDVETLARDPRIVVNDRES